MFSARGSRRMSLALVAAGVMAVAPAALGAEVVPAPPGWGPPEVVSTHAFQDSWEAPQTQVGVTATKVAYAAWLQEVAGGKSRVYGARRDAAGVWSTPVALSAKVSSYRTFDLAVGSQGLASVVWDRRVSGSWRVEESHFYGGAWSAATTVAAGTFPEVAVDGQQVTTVVVHKSGLKAVRRAASGAWSAPKALTPKRVYDVAVAANGPGAVAVTWEEPAGSLLRGVVKPAGQPWRPVRTLAVLPGTAGIGSMEIGFGPVGRALVVWTTTDDWRDGPHVYRNGVGWTSVTSAGVWGTAAYLTRAIGEDGGNLSLSVNDQGQAIAVWTSAGGGSEGWVKLQTSRFRADGRWGAIATLAKKWFETRAWLDDFNTAYVLAQRGQPIWQVTQEPGHPWSARQEVVPKAQLADASGLGARLLMLWVEGSPTTTLTAAALDTTAP